jgi:RNA polymerase sigma-70 factor (ECF subfamily)
MRPPDEDDFRRIYRDTLDGLYGFVSRRCDGDRELAEDITQETWLRAVRAWRVSGAPEQPLAWLTTVSRNLLANHHRRGRVAALGDVHLDTVDVADDAADSLDESEGARRLSLLGRAMARLSESQRGLLHAFHFKRRRVADIAHDDGVSERAIEGRLRRARERLRHHIESELPTGEETP